MKAKSAMRLLTSFMLVLVMALTMLAMAGCGSSSDDSATTTKQTKATKEMTPEEKELSSKAVELNKDEENFYGKWEATSAYAENLYGYLEVTINEDGTVIMDMTDEHLEGTWEKIDGGIHFTNEYFDGNLYYGKKCKMVIKEIEEDDEINVTLKKVE